MHYLIYVYGITFESGNNTWEDIGIDDKPIKTIQYGELFAVTTTLPENRVIKLEDARVHENVLRKIMGENTIAPMSFGFTVMNEAEVLNLLKQGSQVLKNTLQRLTNKTQVDIIVSWDKRVFYEVYKDERIRTCIDKIKEDSQNESLRVELGKSVREVLLRKEKVFNPEILELTEHAVEFKENRVSGDDMILNLSLLVEETQQERLSSAIKGFENKYEGMLQFKTVLPLPPYNFVNIKVEKPNYDEINRARQNLGLETNFTSTELQEAYGKLVKLYHPDRKTGSLNKFKDITKAYDTLKDFVMFYNCSFIKEEVENKLIFKVQ